MRGRGAAVLLTAVISGGATFVVALLPQLDFAYRQPRLHVALETAASLVALLAGFLAAGRLRRAGQLNELLLACALALLALLNLFCLTVPAVTELVPHDVVVPAALAASSLGAVLFALAAFVPRRRLRRPGLGLAAAVAGAATAVVVVTAALAGESAKRVPWAAAAALAPGAPGRPHLHAGPAVLALQLFVTLLYGVAAAGFLRRRNRAGRSDEFLGWLAIAAVLAAASHLNYLLYPSLYSQWVHIGDAFRLCFYAVLLAGSMREIWSYWQALPAAVVAEERRRIARDLHDGLAQELAYLERNFASLDAADDTVSRLRQAVERAQSQSRRAVSTLAAPPWQAVDSALADAAGEIAERFHVGLELDLASGVRLPAARAEALMRIACEAVTNAARHSGARRVRLSMERDGPRVRLRVSDNGRGFGAGTAGGGFGLVSMCERACSVGGELWISSAPGAGSLPHLVARAAAVRTGRRRESHRERRYGGERGQRCEQTPHTSSPCYESGIGPIQVPRRTWAEGSAHMPAKRLSRRAGARCLRVLRYPVNTSAGRGCRQEGTGKVAVQAAERAQSAGLADPAHVRRQ